MRSKGTSERKSELLVWLHVILIMIGDDKELEDLDGGKRKS